MPREHYTMQEWLYTVLQGSVGALLGVIRIVLVFVLTRAHERSQAQASRTLQEAALRRERVAHSVEIVLTAAIEGRRPASLHNFVQSLLSAMYLFVASEGHDYSQAAAWVETKIDAVLKTSNQKVNAAEAVVWEAGFLSAALIKWAGADYQSATTSSRPQRDKSI